MFPAISFSVYCRNSSLLIETLSKNYLWPIHKSYSSRYSYYENDKSVEDTKKMRIPRRIMKRASKLGLKDVDLYTYNRPQSQDKDQTQLHHSSKDIKQLLTDLESAPDSDIKADPPEFPSDISQNMNWFRNQGRKSMRPKIDPCHTSIILFPGQGSQFVGMGRKLLPYPGVEKLYSVASEILGYNLLELCLKGPKHVLDQTIHCQPAVTVTSIAAIEKLKENYPEAVDNCVGTAGFSVGEYAALVFAGSLSFEDAVKIVKVRAEAMQSASESEAGGMMSAFIGHETKLNFALLTAREYCNHQLGRTGAVCCVANYLYPDCKVIAGHDEALNFLEKNYRDFGIRRLKRLPVSGAFHTDMMRSARSAVIKALKETELEKPLIPVHCNVNGERYRNARSMIDLLGQQIYKPVKWEQTMHILYSRNKGENFPRTFEVGPGRQLGTLMKLVNAKAHALYKNIEV